VHGYFISFEGGEGCGKSTQIRLLAAALEAQGHSVVLTREPGGTTLGEALRDLLQHNPAGRQMVPEAELLLFAASRAQLAREVIQPALDAGKIVLCDRYLDSTTVYQGVARALDPAEVATINQFAAGTVRPHCTLLLDLDPETGMERARARTEGKLDRMEDQAGAFYVAVREGFLALAEKEPKRIKVIDGSLSIDAMQSVILSTICGIIEN
jgi:dTMP kinase